MLIGHKKIYEQILGDAANKKLAHSYVFLGPKNVGKTKIALELAMDLQVPDDEKIVERKQIISGADSDTIIFLDDGEILPIEKIREIVARSFLSHTRPHLVFIIENIGRLKIESMNALLKTLEEPNEDVIFFMTANKEEDLIPTIRSRSRVVNFQTIAENELVEICRESPFCDEIISYSMGRPGKVFRLLEDSEYLNAHREITLMLKSFLEAPTYVGVFELSRKMEKLQLLEEFFDLLLAKTRMLTLRQNRGAILSHVDFPKTLDEIELAKRDIIRNVNPKLLLENILIPFVA